MELESDRSAPAAEHTSTQSILLFPKLATTGLLHLISFHFPVRCHFMEPGQWLTGDWLSAGLGLAFPSERPGPWGCALTRSAGADARASAHDTRVHLQPHVILTATLVNMSRLTGAASTPVRRDYRRPVCQRQLHWHLGVFAFSEYHSSVLDTLVNSRQFLN